MRVSTREIMNLGNPQHEDFGVFAKFITGMGETVHIQNVMYTCAVCYNIGVVVTDEKDPHNKYVCMYCRGRNENAITIEKIVKVEVERQPRDIEDFYRNHEHKFKTSKNHPCQVCGVYEAVAGIVSPTTEIE